MISSFFSPFGASSIRRGTIRRPRRSVNSIASNGGGGGGGDGKIITHEVKNHVNREKSWARNITHVNREKSSTTTRLIILEEPIKFICRS